MIGVAPLPRPQPCVTCPPGVPPSAAGWRRGHERSDQSSREAGRRSRWMRREERLSDVPAFSSRSLAGGRYRSRRGRHDVTPPLYKGPLGRFSFFPQRWRVFALGMEFRKTEAFPLMPLKLCVMDEDSVTAAPKYYSHRQTGTYKLETRNGTT
ncbi:uncharacterized protein LOC141565402 isoform X2 [Sminthopsis crassicaudata]|uniref:uncharacterized protein LOC141565402 isoform X2 n=1 Tax=Sminthopsis crassicaudata TaxID=9301 RepID=UPI003D69AB2B